MLRNILILLGLVCTLAACGGGGDSPPNALPTLAITAQPTDISVVAPNTATFTVIATGSGLGYQWQSSTGVGAAFSNIAGVTSASFTTAATAQSDTGKQFRVVVSGSGNSITSSAVTLMVTPAAIAPSITMQPAAQTISAGQNASFSVTATGTSIVYQWQSSSDGGATFANIVGASNATLTLNAVALSSNAQQFRVVVSNGAGSVASSAALLTVTPVSVAPAITAQPASVTVTAPAAATFSVVANGTPNPTLQWQLSTNSGASFSDIGGATTSSYNTAATTTGDSGKQYRVVVSNTVGTVTSNAGTLTVNAAAILPSFTTQPQSATVTAGQNTQLTVAVSGSPTPTLQWQLSTDNGATWGNINGATSAVFDIIAPSIANNGRQFRVVATNSAGSVNSNAGTLTVIASLTVAASPAAGKLAAGLAHTCAIKADATVACWGHGSSGEVLPGRFVDQWTPQVVPGLSGMTYVAVGYQESCAIDTAGILSCWGGGRGINTLKDASNVNLTGVKAVAMGYLHRCLIDDNTTVRCWGRNSGGQLGQGFTADPAVDPYVAVPVYVQRYSGVLTGVVSIAAGDFHTCALRNDGEVVCWGSGAIGDGTTLAKTAVVPAVTGATTIGSSSGHVCAVMAAGGVKCWGGNGYSQLGNRNTTNQLFAVDVIDLPGLLIGVTAIAGESKNTCAIPASGRVVCWGGVVPASLNGNLTYSPTEKGNLSTRVTTIASGWGHSCALVADGSIECWGENQFGQLGLANLGAINTGGPTPSSTSVIGGAVFWK